MILQLIRAILRWRAVVWTVVAAGVLLSLYSIRTASLDAIPDISDPQIVVYVKWPRSPQLLEAQVTEPLISALVGSPGIESLRGASHMGYSFIYVILNSQARREDVQQLVTDRINAIRPQLPADANVTLGPNASSMGWIYQYALVDREKLHDLRELRLLNETQIKPALETVPGIAEVASVGGLEKQYQVKIFPPLLTQTGGAAPAGDLRPPGRVPGSGRADDRGDQPRLSAARRDQDRRHRGCGQPRRRSPQRR
jgi:Cu(I)/Ag(I) efflux system membrane protein CusA/SilA